MLPGSTTSMVDARFLNPDLQLRVLGAPGPDASFNLNVCSSSSRQPVSVTIVSSFAAVVDSGAAATVDGFAASSAGLLSIERSVVDVLLAAGGFGAGAIGKSGAGTALSVSSGVAAGPEAPRSSLGVPPGRPAAIRIAAITTQVITRPIERALPHCTGGVSDGCGVSVTAASGTGRLDRGCDFGFFRPSDVFRSDGRRGRWFRESTCRTRLAGFLDFFAGTASSPSRFRGIR